MAEHSLSKLPRKDSHHLDVLYYGYATQPYCDFNGGSHHVPSRGHKLTSGKAYYLQTSNGPKQAGETCARRLSRQDLHTVPDLTRFVESERDDDDGGNFKSGPLIVPSARFNPERFEQSKRAQDIDYMLLRWKILPEALQEDKQEKKPHAVAKDKRPSVVREILERYTANPDGVELGEIRRQRELAETQDPANSYERLHYVYAPVFGITECLKRGKLDTSETHTMRAARTTLLETHALPPEELRAVNRLIRRVMPNMPLVREDSLLPIPDVQGRLFAEGAGDLRSNLPRGLKSAAGDFDYPD